MSRCLLLALMLAGAAGTAIGAPAIDYFREGRWAQEVVPSIVVGDAVYLATPARPRVLAILTKPAGNPKGGVILVHGMGVHPDWAPVGGVRSYLADAGFTTLSVQMPVLPALAPRDDYRIALPEAGDRIAAAIAYLRGRGLTRIAVVAHSLGATMVDAYLARPEALPIDAWVPVGMPVDFSAPPRAPVADIIAGNDLPEVRAMASARAARLPGDRCSAAVTVAGTNHYFERKQEELAQIIAGFLERVFAGGCA